MAKKQTGKRRPTTGKKKSGKSGAGAHLLRVLMGVTLLSVVVVAGLWTLRLFVPAPAVDNPATREKTTPTYEIYPRDIPKSALPVPEPMPRPDHHRPKVVIIVDDIGYDVEIAEKLLSLEAPLTLSLLPFGPFTAKIAEQAGGMGRETMLHLPMEPKEYPAVKPGPGGLLTTMAPDVLIAQLERDIAAVPGIKGVNNHMGSKMTANSSQMNQIFTVLKSKNLYFVDSLTVAGSVGESSARLFKVPFEERDVFIDHVQDPDFIRGQMERLMRIAEKYGTSVGIAHPHEVTYQVMHQMMPELTRRVEVVPASQLVAPPG